MHGSGSGCGARSSSRGCSSRCHAPAQGHSLPTTVLATKARSDAALAAVSLATSSQPQSADLPEVPAEAASASQRAKREESASWPSTGTLDRAKRATSSMPGGRGGGAGGGRGEIGGLLPKKSQEAQTPAQGRAGEPARQVEGRTASVCAHQPQGGPRAAHSPGEVAELQAL